MIKSGEYIQLLQFFGKIENINFMIYYSGLQSIEVIEACKRFDEIRIIHNKYKIHAENWNVYPHKDLTEMNMIKDDIIRITNEFKIQYMFTSRDMLSFKKGIHARYYFEDLDITDLIVFHKKRENSSISH